MLSPCKILLLVLLFSVSVAGGARAGGGTRIVIDPGHGGSDPGASGNGLVEKDLNLVVALRLAALLDADTADTSGGGTWQVLLTRSTDVFVSLQGRVNIANAWPADRFISIHHNSFTSSAAHGTETYSFQEGTFSADLRDKVQEELVGALGLTDRGSKTANFFVLSQTSMPAVLSEAGFLTSPGDAAVLSNPAAQQAAAEAHLFGLQRHYGLAPYLPLPDPNLYCTAKLNSAGCLPQIGWSGVPSSSAGFSLTCQNVIGGQAGLMFWSRTPADVPFMGGRLCLAGPFERTPVAHSGGVPGSNCTGSLSVFLSPAYLASRSLGIGSVIHAQWWYRDPFLSSDRVGLSAGLRVVLQP
ncbi:MAG: N-acetylmuramoyl-L-alanine amidase [bacterium]|jgi:N-acetylmuramoyl-L-alanine amidase|nr:N-acetylmuramoyl-L-alanine amidase [Planctomycetota bacterium]HIL50970.1 N-acetylmuramoyl-L-alanine amidase [Planctomycetota bacterium]